MTREEILKQMVDGKIFKDKRNGYFLFLSECGTLMFSNKDGKRMNSPHFYAWEHLEPVEEKKSYWLWMNPETGRVSDYFADENFTLPNGVKHGHYRDYIKLEWSKIEL